MSFEFETGIEEMRRSDQVDALIKSIAPDVPGAVLIAVGGYGRQDLFPYSDIDLLLVSDAAVIPQFSGFFRVLWDQGLRVSSSTRTLVQCVVLHEDNLELTLSLFDRCYLCGDLAVWEQLDQGFVQLVRRKHDQIASATVQLTRARHNKYHNTIYHLEPNVKDGPGGLRDFHILQWFGQTQNVAVAAATLARLRIALHEYFGRDTNVLTFEAQENIGPAPDQVMSEYFHAARKMQRAVNAWMEAVEDRSVPFLARMRDRNAALSTSVFAVRHGKVYFQGDEFPQDLSVFRFVAHYGLRLSPEAGRALHDCLLQPQCRWPQLQDVLGLPHAALALREMHDTGVLGRVFSGWARVEGLVVRDYYHQYTVDEHSLVAIENILRLREEPADRFPTLARETAQYPLLIMALLLHDTGKGQHADSHAEAAARAAAPELEAIGMPDDDRELVQFLIGAHLEMSRIMTTRDLSDPRTAASVAALTGSQHRLTLLTLMTYADISAVNPRSLTPWRLTLLWQLYTATAEIPCGERASLEWKPGVALSHGNGVWTLTLAAMDRPFLFASVAGAISSFGMDILRAEAYTGQAHTACERFTFTDPFRTLELNPEEVEAMTATLERVASSGEDVQKLLKRRVSRLPGSSSMEIHFDGQASQCASLVTITTEDRPELLYQLAQVISSEGCNIETVLINTEGRKAVDVFYITQDGKKLSEEKQAHLAERIRAINAPLS